jgi:hypothetical protein
MADDPQETEQIEQESEEAVETQESEEADSVETESSEEVEESQDDSGEPEDVENLVKSERGQKRIQELANKASKAEELEGELKTLRDRLVDQGSTKEQATQDILEELRRDGNPYTGDYLQDLQIVEERATQKALNRFQKVQGKRERFNEDVRKVEDSYSELREGSKNFDPDLTNDIVSLYRDSSRLNPDLELKPFVDRIMRVRQRSMTEGSSASVEEITQQERESAVKPSTAKKQTKDPKEMTFEELKEIVPR